ncbi:ABC transporter permease [Spirosoma litoris]
MQGDLHERYERDVRQLGAAKAARRYWLNVLGFLKPRAGLPFVLKRKPGTYPSLFFLSSDMILNYVKIARRQLWRNRLFTALNVIGLSIGLSACWIIYRIVSFDFSFDTQNPNRDRIVRIVSQFVFDGQESGNPGTPIPMADAVRREVSGVERSIPIYEKWMKHVQIPQPTGKPVLFDDVKNVVATDTNYFRMVPYQWLAGNPAQALARPNQVVLTQSRAAQYFPGLLPQQLMNRTITYWDTVNVQVAGVVADLPYASDFSGKEFMSLSTLKTSVNPEEWGNTNSDVQLFLMLADKADQKQVESQINLISTKNSGEILKKWGNMKRWHTLQPLADLHFGVELHERDRRANKQVLYGLIGLASFILILAIINYINLASAQVPQRAREIGIRKTLGSRRWPLIFQFLGETAAITLLAFGLSYGLSRFFFSEFGDLVPEDMDQYVNWPMLVLFLIGLLILVTLLAGLYPGRLITRFQPVAVLRGQTGYTLNEGQNRLSLRKSLIVFQFFIAQLFIVGALIVGQQLQYSLQADMGFVRDAVLTANVPWNNKEENRVSRLEALKQELKKLPGVSAVSLGNQPASNSYSSNTHQYTGKKGKVELNLYRKYVDTDYIPLYQLPLIAGRNLQPSDTIREYVLNETATKAFGFNRPQDAIGAFLKENGGDAGRLVPIVGVVRDFHTRSFKEKIQPTALMMERGNLNTFNIKLASGQPTDWQNTIASLNSTWKRFYPDVPLDYKFYDQTLEDFYKQERQLSRVVNLATGIAILISCLGLFGLATLMAFQRTKEIGIRKVLGASIARVVTLLSKDFLKPVLLAIVLASPLAWYVMNKWLQEFAYKIDIAWWTFAMAGLLALGIALLTVSFQSIKAALVNPAKSLRSE